MLKDLPKQAGLLRCRNSCRLRWVNYLRPGIMRGDFIKEEEETIIQLQYQMGNKWSKIASFLPRRTDKEIRNVWKKNLKKQMMKKGDQSNHHGNTHGEITENNESNQNSSLPKSSDIEKYRHSSSKFTRSEDTNIMTTRAYEEDLEMSLNLDSSDLEIFLLDGDFSFLDDLINNEEPIETYQPQRKELDIDQSNCQEEKEKQIKLKEFIRNLENELLQDPGARWESNSITR